MVGRPFLGAFFGVLPDVVIGIKRKALPSLAYNFTHSLLGVGILALAGTVVTGSLACLLALTSHLVLDIPTHGEQWAPPLLFPFDAQRFSYGGEEWEWFNPVWCFGFMLTIFWCAICFSFALAIGSL